MDILLLSVVVNVTLTSRISTLVVYLLKVIILGALVGAIITLLAIIILFLMRPKVLTREETKQILQIPSDKKQLKKLLSVEKTQELQEVWQFCPIHISASSTNSKTGEEPMLTQITDTDDTFKAMPELPSYMTHMEGGQPVVFHFKEEKPETAVLPVYIMTKDGNEIGQTITLLKSSGSEKKELAKSLIAKTELRTAQSLSIKKGSMTTTSAPSASPSSSSSAIRKTNTEKDATQMATVETKDENKSKTITTTSIKSVDEGNKANGSKLSTKLPSPSQPSPSQSPQLLQPPSSPSVPSSSSSS
ncbi:conserved hypothetical protein [Brugia malayi]|uniref:Bm9222 n=2 Tax=Brugia malayi TaxID=6279 RepID=A0A4E9F764_BRUMA|nr:uncharacterized protein BM_BM9222 [Brugia malayi]CDP93245.1 Bm9222 [Brugia malayi]VIO91977.1 conserved hypothetical protein [Brugia malayi]